MTETHLKDALESIPAGGPIEMKALRQRALRDANERIRRRRAVEAVAVVLVLMVASGAALRLRPQTVVVDTVHPAPAPHVGPAATVAPATAGVGDEGYVNPERALRYHQWLSEYDPAEVAMLRSTWADAPDVHLVTTLEFRRACRVTYTAWQQAQTGTPEQRKLAVYEIMDPEIDRLEQRKPSDKTQSVGLFRTLRDRLVEGDPTVLRELLDRVCPNVDMPPVGSTEVPNGG